MLLCGAGGAYAVAQFGPDASDLPVQRILLPITSLADQQSADSLLPAVPFTLYRSDVTRSSDTADSLLQRLGIADTAAAAFLRSDATARQALLDRAGRSVSAETTDEHALQRLTARWAADDSGNFQRLVIERNGTGFASRVETAPLVATSRLSSGTITSSLFAATDEANLPDAVAGQIAEIFSTDIDFRRALRRGDRCSVVYESLEADGEPLRTGRVLSAEFANGDKTFQAMWFQEPGQKGAYYGLDGRSLRHAYLSSPVAFTRVSSGFAMRFHPILHTWTAHKGTDFAAPEGTPVRTVGDGVVEFAGVQNGYGNVVFVKHRDSNHVTVYAHLSRIGVRPGQIVAQGDVIGNVGATGWATGPHLHFEFRVGGVQQDPMTIARQSGSVPISAAARPAFDKLAASMRMQLSAAALVQQASAE
nr:peptidoglycan DD-metalloendopeptidase family protein [Xylophilus sp.]